MSIGQHYCYLLFFSCNHDHHQGPHGWEDLDHVDSAWVTILLSDVNDNPPVFLRPHADVTVSEDAAPGTLLASLSARDADEVSVGRRKGSRRGKKEKDGRGKKRGEKEERETQREQEANREKEADRDAKRDRV